MGVELNALFQAFFNSIGYLFILIIIGLFLDSYILAAYFTQTQILANIVTALVFIVVYKNSVKRSRELMIYAVLIGIFGEYLFSLGLDMYSYRLGNVPFYIPLGHALVYITTVTFCKRRIINKHSIRLQQIFTALIFGYSLFFLMFKTDVFGFVMTLAVIYLLRNRQRERLFFLTMYLVVAFLEIIGTTYQCWYWPDTALGVIPFLKSSNPPSGISLFYFLLDLGCLWFYKKRHLSVWLRMKKIRQIRSQKPQLNFSAIDVD